MARFLDSKRFAPLDLNLLRGPIYEHNKMIDTQAQDHTLKDRQT